MNRTITIALLILCLSSCGQTSKKIEKKLERISTIEQLDKLRSKYPNWQIDVVEVNSDETDIDSKVKSLKTGETITIKEKNEEVTYKMLESQNIKEFRVSHLYLDRKVLSIEEIDSIRTEVLEKYNDGVPFAELSKQYASYDTPNDGDLGWIKEGMMVPDFENAVKEHKKGDVFTVDIPSNGWYYVVLKTFDDRETRTLKLIKVKCGS